MAFQHIASASQDIGVDAGSLLSQDNGATMSSTALPGLGKVFRAEVVLPMPVARLHQELFERIEQMPQWNPAISAVKVKWGGMHHRQSYTIMGRHQIICIARVASIKKKSYLLRGLRLLKD